MKTALALDHVGVLAFDLDAAERLWRRMGFRLTPRSQHFGSVTPGGPIEPFGSSNHCVMFQQGYLEIQGVTAPSLFNRTSALLEKYEGMHIVAFTCEDADTAYESLISRHVRAKAPVALQRDVVLQESGSPQQVGFKNIYMDSDFYPEARFIVIEHRTRDVMWQPHLLEHPNGAVALDGVSICSTDPISTGERLSHLFGQKMKHDAGQGVIHFELRRGNVHVLDSAALARQFPQIGSPPCLPWVAGSSYTVSDLEVTRRVLRAAEIPFFDAERSLVIRPDDALGVLVVFHQQDNSRVET